MHPKLTDCKPWLTANCRLAPFLSLILLAAGCATDPASAPVQEYEVAVERRVIAGTSGTEDDDYQGQPLEQRQYQIEQAERYSQIAADSGGNDSVDATLSAAEFYIQAEDPLAAERSVASLEPSSLSPVQRNRYQIIRAYSDYSRGDNSTALERLESILKQPPPLADEQRQQRVDALLLGSFIHQQAGAIEPALGLLLERESLLAGAARAETSRYIWQVINTVPAGQREQILLTTENLQLRNRLEQSLTGQIGQQETAPSRFEQWRGSEVDASHTQPTRTSTWNQFSPRSISILLPESSRYKRAAQAVKDGIMYQHQLNDSAYKPVLNFYDIGSDAWQVGQYYNAAVQRGSDLIIGPLGKDYADTLVQSAQGALNVPTILLGGELPLTGAATRLDLSPEHESQWIAERAAARGYVNAVVLAPSNARGERAARSFTEAWLQRGGKISKVVNYSPDQFDHSTELTLMFDLNQSRARHRLLSDTLSYRPKFSPYRRQDIDFIYLVADTKTGRIVRPQINFFGGNQMPVIASSAVYNGIEAVAENMDLNNTVFPAMPWELTSQGISPYAGQLNRLFALGSDAYQLATELRELRSGANYALQGNSGNLSLASNREIKISPIWAVFRDGKVETDAELTPLDLDRNPLLERDGYQFLPGGRRSNRSQGRNNYDESNWDPRESRRKPGS